MRRTFLAVFAMCLTLLLAGCQTLSFASAGDLLRAPALGEEPGAVQRALTAEVGEVNYKYPKEGENHSPLLLVDLTGNGEEEGVMFFAQGEGNSNVQIAVLQKREGEWQLADRAIGSGPEVASVEVADLYGDGSQVLIVGYANSNLGGKTLQIYQFNGQTLEPPTGLGSYDSYLLGDFTGMGGTDLAVVSRGDADAGLRLQLISGRDGSIQYVQEDIELLSLFGSCAGIYTSVSEDSSKYLVVDGIIEANKYLGTQVLAYSETTGLFYVREPEAAAQINAVNRTSRSLSLLVSRDIDGDGVVETPVPLEYVDENPVDEGLEISFIEWWDYTAEEPAAKHFGVFDAATGLYIQMPGQWKDSVRIGATETGWRVRSRDTARTLLEYRTLAEDEEKPANAIYVVGNTDACLVPAVTLNAMELLLIDSVLLV